ncbi:unnamed protein product [Caenorhabditis angaria]|uniref:NADP-dependent oxidoreductase domain-containing protein n=1 Tax=Caenorhabditis angaria TaxID=860376 RepID=A0A9P1NAL7_9PELO|nr:unnamed protein product [Caenorhabditis angaria]
MVAVPQITLSNGVSMPAVGLGTWQSTPEEVKKAVRVALESGYRLIDTAAIYQNEEAIGEAVEQAIADGIVTREQLFITTKAWTHEFAPGKLEAALRESLRKLKTTYVDLYLAHMPTATAQDGSALDVTVEQVWQEFEHVYNLGLAKAVGVSNWNNDQIARVLKSGKVAVHNSQVELHLYFAQHDHHDFCKANNISVTSYATLGSPGRVHFKLPTGQKVEWAPAASDLEDSNVVAIAEKHHKTPAQVLLRYALDRGIAIIPKSITPSRIVENFQLFDFQLTQDEIALLESHKVNQRLFLQEFMAGHKEDAFPSER